ncbi:MULTISPECIES: carboxymuconolactone decarboxylase family protein [unclassified Tatumella]|uniref:carboxymuconolactone decarboxylase family protein n=1 Tax=unclassified Tatumella TaxID=2649542 RepID=UPI001BAE71F4|nr:MULTISPECIES: carboxymuconolactone decarboxylase family protein [unclassified Tatumella]MBS0877419.1 carboxymuconolactone decarboxylase family protein [Tatumella sp. JGM82]MBS0890708.1 carboxymuconolactone decarboxylase family protein [Tatumella sp. JGM94]MBS0893505.1 carboxymuconolactone decarboxylase family protein [Tatumella sp. JGM130]MBS0901816.1 carboxymuconolactone decarboxylase family protein [Tatumella sp. JGM100]
MTITNRLPPLAPEDWSDEQRTLAEEVIQGPRGALLPPFQALLRSPELMAHAQRLGEYLRYRSAIGLRLSELAILVTARYWGQPVEWEIHAPIARGQGISEQAIDAIQHQQRPADTALQQDEWLVYQFCQQLHQQKHVSDDIWQQSVAQFGEAAVMDLIGINGYYSLLAMVMNVARTPAQHTPIGF